MIEGLKFKVTGQELQGLLEARVTYHESRALTKEKDLPELKAAMEKLKNTPTPQQMMTKSTASYRLDVESPVEQLEADIKRHWEAYNRYKFLASHVIDDDYQLSVSDLAGLEIVQLSLR